MSDQNQHELEFIKGELNSLKREIRDIKAWHMTMQAIAAGSALVGLILYVTIAVFALFILQ